MTAEQFAEMIFYLKGIIGVGLAVIVSAQWKG